MENFTVDESEAVQYLVSTYCGPYERFDRLPNAKAQYREWKKNYGTAEIVKVSTKTITIEKRETIAS